MAKLRFGDVYEQDNCGSPMCNHWLVKPRWKIWVAWFLRLCGWKGDPS